eukprot:6171109-Amphidinium_carterae.6
MVQRKADNDPSLNWDLDGPREDIRARTHTQILVRTHTQTCTPDFFADAVHTHACTHAGTHAHTQTSSLLH